MHGVVQLWTLMEKEYTKLFVYGLNKVNQREPFDGSTLLIPFKPVVYKEGVSGPVH